MFLYKVDDDLFLKLVELRDAERKFELANQSRAYLKKVEDTKEFIAFALKDYAENKSMNTAIL